MKACRWLIRPSPALCPSDLIHVGDGSAGQSPATANVNDDASQIFVYNPPFPISARAPPRRLRPHDMDVESIDTALLFHQHDPMQLQVHYYQSNQFSNNHMSRSTMEIVILL